MSDVPLVYILFSLSFFVEFLSLNQRLIPFFFLKQNKKGFGVTARSTTDTKKLDPTSIIVFHQADVGEYLRDEVRHSSTPSPFLLSFFLFFFYFFFEGAVALVIRRTDRNESFLFLMTE